MVIWSGPARRDLRGIYNYIAQDSKYYAKHVVERIVEKTEELKSFPQMGRKVPEVDDPEVREILTYSYRLIYEVSGQEIHILAVIHARRDVLSSHPDMLKRGT